MSRAGVAEALYDTWDISGDAFPVEGTPADKFRFLLKYAVLAPSKNNSQPWLFRIQDDHLEFYADRARALPVVDPEDRQLIISCGAALFHLCITMRHFGYEDEMELFPEPNIPDLLARVRLGNRWQPSQEEHALFYAIVTRHTNRMPYFAREVPKAVLADLEDAAQQQGAWLRVVHTEEDRNALAALTSEADRVQWSDKRFRRELASWVHPNRSMSKDGMPAYAMGIGDIASVAGPLVIRTFDMGGGRAARDQELASGSPVLAVLGTPGDSQRDWLKAGEALARVLLHATAERVSASFLNQPVEVPELRLVLQDVLNTEGFPQIVLRMGYGPEAMLTPRRPIEDVLVNYRAIRFQV